MTVPVLELMKAARDAVEEALNQLCIYDDTNTAANFWPAVHLGEASASLNAVIKTLEEAEEAERYEKEAEETFLRARFGPYIDDKTEPDAEKAPQE